MRINLAQLRRRGYHIDIDETLDTLQMYPENVVDQDTRESVKALADHHELSEVEHDMLFSKILVELTKIDLLRSAS